MLPLHQAIPRAARQLTPPRSASGRGVWCAKLRGRTCAVPPPSFHKDLYLCHFFIRRADINSVPTWTDRVFIIDFHRLAPSVHAFLLDVEDLGQLLYSSQVIGIDARDRLGFWR